MTPEEVIAYLLDTDIDFSVLQTRVKKFERLYGDDESIDLLAEYELPYFEMKNKRQTAMAILRYYSGMPLTKVVPIKLKD